MQFPHLCSRKWFQLIVVFLILYAFLKMWFFDRKVNKFDSRFTSFENFKLWAKYLKSKTIIDVLEILPNCGIPYTCPENTFPVHIYTGRRNNDYSKLCIMGKYLTNHAGNGGRGMNIVLINSKRLGIKDFVTFDVYTDNSVIMDMWLNESVKQNDIILIYTFDEASRKLTESSKKIFYDYGSSKIQDLHFRSQWYMITQKGIRGFTPFEKVTMAHNGNWVTPIRVSPPIMPNAKSTVKEKFCRTHEEMRYRYFCYGMKKYDDISPAPLTDRSLVGNVIFSVPVAIIMTHSDDDMEQIDSFVMTMESLIRQPGIDPSNVYVFFNKSSQLISEIVNIFRFHLIVLNITSPADEMCIVNYKFMETAIRMLGRKERYVMILNSGLILSPDFLYFMSQLVTIADIDRSVVGISSWNVNGYKTVSSNVRVVYRVQDLPSVGFLVRSDICTKRCQFNVAHSCINTSTMAQLMNVKVDQDVHILVPDVSRVLWRPYPELIKKSKNNYWHRIVTAERNTNTESGIVLRDPRMLVNSSYFEYISNLLKSSMTITFDGDEIKNCENGDSFPVKLLSKFQSKAFSVFYDEIDDRYETTLKSMARCFGIYTHKNFNLGGSYYGVFRLTINENDVLFVKSGSPFYKSMSSNIK